MSSSYFPLSKASSEPTSLCLPVVPLVPTIFINTFASVPAPSELPVVTFKVYSEKIENDQQFCLTRSPHGTAKCSLFLRSYNS